MNKKSDALKLLEKFSIPNRRGYHYNSGEPIDNEEVMRLLRDGLIYAFGYERPEDSIPRLITEKEWSFLEFDYTKGAASGQGLYFGAVVIRAFRDFTYQELFDLEDLIELSEEYAAGRQSQQSPVREYGRLGVFQQMENLRASEVTIRFVPGGQLDILARGELRRFGYGELDLANRNKNEEPLNKPGDMLFLAAKGRLKRISSTVPGNRKAISQLRSTLKNLLGLVDNPIVYEGNAYVMKLTVEDKTQAFHERQKKRRTEFLKTNEELEVIENEQLEERSYQLGGEDDYTFEDESDKAGRWIKDQQKQDKNQQKQDKDQQKQE